MNYTLRYVPGTDLNVRKHAPTARKFGSWVEAEDYRESLPTGVRNLLETVQRFGYGDGRGL